MNKLIINSNNIDKEINIEKKIKELQYKLVTYIDLYNIKYTNIYENDDFDNINNSDESEYIYLEKDNDDINNDDINNEVKNNINNDIKKISIDTYSYINDTYESQIKYNTIFIEKIGNIELLYRNYNNLNKKIANYLIFYIRKKYICNLLEHLYYILDLKGFIFDFIIYDYELYKINGVDNMYLIQKKIKGITINFMKPCVLYIFIRDKLFIHNY
jgi:hypothetical protein